MKILNPDGKVNLHTHTKYCDGTDSPEELVCEAVKRGFSALGFSGHEYSVYDGGFCMSREDTKRYRSEILDLKEKYRGQIDIYLGIERDYFGEGDDYPYDYVIGSLHYTKAPGGGLLCVDESEEGMVRNVTNFFGGDFRAYVESYYALIGAVAEKTHADIIGHFDLITKFNEGGKYFDENAKWYKKAALRALAQAAEKRPEATGADRTLADFFLKRLRGLAVPSFCLQTAMKKTSWILDLIWFWIKSFWIN